MYNRQAPSAEKKYINWVIIFLENLAENIKLFYPNSPFLMEISCNIWFAANAKFFFPKATSSAIDKRSSLMGSLSKR